MCHIIYISTDSMENLSDFPNDIFTFSKDPWHEAPKNLLKYPNQYLLAHKIEGCSCFARVLPYDMGYVKPQDWYDELDPENYPNIEATFAIFDVIKDLVNQGFAVDCVATWSGEPLEYVDKCETVLVNQLERSHFAFFDATYFRYL